MLIFVYKHALCTECLATGDFSVSDIQINLLFVSKTRSTVQYIVSKFKYTGSIKNVPRKPKRKILSAREERYLVNIIRKNRRLIAPNLRGIVENTTRKTMCNQTSRRVFHKYDFHGRKV